MIESELKSDHLIAFISKGYCLYIGTEQAPEREKISELLNSTEKRPALLATSSESEILFGIQSPNGKVLYSGPTKAEFLSRVRLLENTNYHWEIFKYSKNKLEILDENHGLIIQSSVNKTEKNRISVRWEQDNRQCRGVFNFGNFLGSGSIGISKTEGLTFEVISNKLDYEQEYLALIKDLSDKALSLLLDFDTPTSSQLTIDQTKDSKSIFESYLLLKTALPINDFSAALAQIKARPHSILVSEERWMPSSLASGLYAMNDPISRIRWARSSSSGKPVAVEVLDRKRLDTNNTVPNQFARFSLEKFSRICLEISENSSKFGKTNATEALQIHKFIENELRSGLLKSVSRLGRIPYENQVLQKREGYKQLLRTWILTNCSLAVRDLQDNGVLSPTAENRAVPDLYEYWLFFFLAQALEELNGAKKIERNYVKELNQEGVVSIKLDHSNKPRLTLELPMGEETHHLGLYYNRTFEGGENQPSYSMKLRPDYTIETFVGYGSNYLERRVNALKNCTISYLHFDAKFRIQKVNISETDSDNEDQDELSAKPSDIYKMHTYNEAIRGTAASVILFPGNTNKEGELNESYRKYFELIPGVGALAIKPGDEKSRKAALISTQNFILEALGCMPNSPSNFSDFKKWEVNAVKGK